MKRPALSESSFLGHLFAPKKHALPTGLRHQKLKGGRGTSKARVAAYNRMSAASQETLKRSGTRDAYLKGQGTLGDAKKALRPVAVRLGLAKPARIKPPSAGQPGSRAALDAYIKGIIAQNVITKTRDAGKNPDIHAVAMAVDHLDPALYDPEMKRWDYGHIKHAGRKGSEYEVWVDGKKLNTFWYH